MKIRMGFKTPDAMDDAIKEAVDAEMEKLKPDQQDVDADDLAYEAKLTCSRWVKWGEYITVEVDTDKGTCEVVPA
jgi:hypothetical protein